MRGRSFSCLQKSTLNKSKGVRSSAIYKCNNNGRTSKSKDSGKQCKPWKRKWMKPRTKRLQPILVTCFCPTMKRHAFPFGRYK